MLFKRPSSGLQKAAIALASAGGIAHVVFLSLFAWRVIARGGLARYMHALLAVLAVVGFAASFVGGLLVKHGGRSKARTLGLWAIGFGSALAGVLLVAASTTE